MIITHKLKGNESPEEIKEMYNVDINDWSQGDPDVFTNVYAILRSKKEKE